MLSLISHLFFSLKWITRSPRYFWNTLHLRESKRYLWNQMYWKIEKKKKLFPPSTFVFFSLRYTMILKSFSVLNLRFKKKLLHKKTIWKELRISLGYLKPSKIPSGSRQPRGVGFTSIAGFSIPSIPLRVVFVP